MVDPGRGIQLRTVAACCSANGHRWAVTAGLRDAACSSIALAESDKSRTRRSAMPFWWCAPTPQKEMVWASAATLWRKRAEAKTPLSAW